MKLKTKYSSIFSSVFVLLLLITSIMLIHGNSHSPYAIGNCLLNMGIIEMGVSHYWLEHGHLPQYGTAESDNHLRHSWRVLILPHIGYKDLYDQYDFNEPWDGPRNKKLHDQMPNKFRCPLDREQNDNCSTYMMVIHPDAKHKPNNKYFFIIETNNTTHNWLEPIDFPIENFHLEPDRNNDHSQLRRSSKHYKKYGFSRIYGTVTNMSDCCLSEDTKPEALKALADPEERKRVEITSPWGENFGIQRAVLKEP